MADAQTRLQKSVEGFHFNLGFSGKYFRSGNTAENAGDDLLLGGSFFHILCGVLPSVMR